MDKGNVVSIANSQNYFSDVSLATNVIFIKTHFGFYQIQLPVSKQKIFFYAIQLK